MRPTTRHARILRHPFAYLLQGARLISIRQGANDLVLDLHGCQQTSSRIVERRGRLFEQAGGCYVPMRLHFSKIEVLTYPDFFGTLEEIPLEEPSRMVLNMYSWQPPRRSDSLYAVFLQEPAAAKLLFSARDVKCSPGRGKIPFAYERSWSPAPPLPARLVPRPAQLHRRFGGDPITIKIAGRTLHHRLFIGGTDIQPLDRPDVHAVVNLGETPSRWLRGKNIPLYDRAIMKGEGSKGMSVQEIREEANWIIDRLKNNHRVLVHCAAGMNRSATVSCAVLMLLEGLSAEKALMRVREHHPWAQPDSHHWLALRWLEKKR